MQVERRQFHLLTQTSLTTNDSRRTNTEGRHWRPTMSADNVGPCLCLGLVTQLIRSHFFNMVTRCVYYRLQPDICLFRKSLSDVCQLTFSKLSKRWSSRPSRSFAMSISLNGWRRLSRQTGRPAKWALPQWSIKLVGPVDQCNTAVVSRFECPSR